MSLHCRNYVNVAIQRAHDDESPTEVLSAYELIVSIMKRSAATHRRVSRGSFDVSACSGADTAAISSPGNHATAAKTGAADVTAADATTRESIASRAAAHGAAATRGDHATS
jgi:hypothetical protein